MLIRTMTLEDIPQVLALHEQLFNQSFNFIDYATEKDFYYGIIMEVEGSIVGYLVGQIIFEMSDLYYVAVDPQYRSLGYGRLLVEYFIQDAFDMNGESMTLEVRRSNQIAISLYKKCGFVPVGVRPNYYADSEDAILMIRKFK